MRKKKTSGPLALHAIAGSYVVTLGIDMEEAASAGVLGFGIQRKDHTEGGPPQWLLGFKQFPGSKAPKGGLVPTNKHPLQTFLWGDYTTRLGHEYTYRVVAMRGTPKHLVEGEEVSVRVRMEDEDKGRHAVYFNRGVAGSQAYARKFKNAMPEDVPGDAAWRWLSRGLEEALLAFIAQAKSQRWGLRAAVYEFHYPAVLEAFRRARDAGADVKVVFDARENDKDFPDAANREALENAHISDPGVAIPRTANPSFIAHNKFIVLLKDGEPVSVWTGSTNISLGGIFGHSNVGHVVRDAAVAGRYLQYWKQLAHDPSAGPLRTWDEANSTVPALLPPKNSVRAIFSPRPSLAALQWYADRMDSASTAVFLTAAFGVNDKFERVLGKDKDYLRYVLLETEGNDIAALRGDPDNRIAVGSVLGKEGFERWLKERTVPGLNTHVKYIHDKFMLIDPLSDDPLVITGSANFSDASTKENDENMLVIRGDKRVADIYLGEFMRLFTHFYFRYVSGKAASHAASNGHANGSSKKKKVSELCVDDSWREPYYEADTPKRKERLYFAG